MAEPVVRILFSTVLVFSWTLAGAADAMFDRTHAVWAELLGRHVQWNQEGTATRVDYDGFKVDAPQLSAYLSRLSRVRSAEFGEWPKDDREAFLINDYNAATVQRVLERYPELDSIKDLAGLFSSPWKKQVLYLLGEHRSLHAIEHDLLRDAADFSEPRIHFAVNCASIGCPALRPEAYVGTRLRAQLEDQTLRFLHDRSRNHLDDARSRLEISRIFDWYAGDFDASSGGIRNFLADRGAALGLDPNQMRGLRNGELAIAFGEYDWSLNRALSQAAR